MKRVMPPTQLRRGAHQLSRCVATAAGCGRHTAARQTRGTGSATLPCLTSVLAYLAGADVSRAAKCSTSSANFRWLASNCSVKS